MIRRPGKAAEIRDIVETFPQRRFVLVGDSCEKDPEIYGNIARKYPDRVASVLIRDVPARTLDERRRRKAFHNLPEGRWKVFTDPEEIAADLPRL